MDDSTDQWMILPLRWKLPPVGNETVPRKIISIMAAEHETNETGKKIGIFKAGSYIGGITVVSLLAGFGLTLGRVKRKNPTEFGELGASKLALKALGYGTLLSVTGCGLLVIAVKWALGVKNIKEFSTVMKRTLPAKDGEFVQKFESWRLPRTSSPDDEKEWNEAMSK